ncbi:hypothetical protein ILUMI_10864 [Ignelater luminosus]|uniref:Uncharacterized protein n=1 Tax=Ignelater luminosus TaxID=2038154 RepID=A0A8K0CZK5_IGNLU|nr:hypothetical protein ILUMI_10864 [Ignelater luminosus]
MLKDIKDKEGKLLTEETTIMESNEAKQEPDENAENGKAITRKELEESRKRIKVGKSTEHNGIAGEMLKRSSYCN